MSRSTKLFLLVFFVISCSFVFVTYFVPLPCKLNGQTWSILLFLVKCMVEIGLKTHRKCCSEFFGRNLLRKVCRKWSTGQNPLLTRKSSKLLRITWKVMRKVQLRHKSLFLRVILTQKIRFTPKTKFLPKAVYA